MWEEELVEWVIPTWEEKEDEVVMSGSSLEKGLP